MTLSIPSQPLTSEAQGDSLPPSQYMKTSRVLGELLMLARGSSAGEDQGRIKDIARRLLSVLHHRDSTTVEHSRRVALISVGIAEMLGWTARERSTLEVAAVVHDIGKIGVPDHILLKPGKLSPAEYDLIVQCHRVAVSIFQACRADRALVQTLSQLHDQYSDSKDFHADAQDVHLGARILAVADAYDSLSTKKSFRRGHTHEDVMAILNDQSGSRFDGNIVRALARWYDREGKSLLALETGEEAAERRHPTPEQAAEIHLFGCIFGCLSLIESTYEGFAIYDKSERIIVWNSGAQELFGRSADDLIGQRNSNEVLPRQMQDESGNQRVTESTVAAVIREDTIKLNKQQMQRADGSWIEVEVETFPLHDRTGEICGVAEIFHDRSDSTNKPAAYRELKLQASRDPLTAVANRGRLESQLEKMMEELNQTSGAFPVSVIFLDVDHFKSVNDTHGHTVGDRVLVELAKLLQHETYSGELVGRYGGEEFVLLCPDTGVEDAVRRAERLRQAIAASDVWGIEDRKITASFGVGQVELSDTVQEAFSRADQCLYQAKQTGRNRVCWPECDEEEKSEEELEPVEDKGTIETTEEGTFFRTSVVGNFSTGILRIKLGTFAQENGGELLDYTDTSATVRLGERGLLPFWGSEENRKPVEVELKFSEVRGIEPDRKRPYRPTQVDISITAIGWVRRVQVFEDRCRSIMRGLQWILSIE